MSDLTPEDRALLDLARGGHDPGPDDRHRIRSAIAAQLGIAAGLVSASAGAGGSGAAVGILSGAGWVAVKVIGAAALVGSLCAGSVAAYRVLEAAPPAPKAAPSSVVQMPAPLVQGSVAESASPTVPATVIAEVPAEAMPPRSNPPPVAYADSNAGASGTDRRVPGPERQSTIRRAGGGESRGDERGARRGGANGVADSRPLGHSRTRGGGSCADCPAGHPSRLDAYADDASGGDGAHSRRARLAARGRPSPRARLVR